MLFLVFILNGNKKTIKYKEMLYYYVEENEFINFSIYRNIIFIAHKNINTEEHKSFSLRKLNKI